MRRKDPDAIRRARKRAQLTQRELAYLAKCTHATIYLLEKAGVDGMQTCSEELATAICSRLKVDVEDLFERRDAPGRRRVSSVRPDTGQESTAANTIGAAP